MNRFQQAAIAAYPDGEILAPDGIGDSLFKFVLTELSDNEDCSTLCIAKSRMKIAIAELSLVLEALETLET